MTAEERAIAIADKIVPAYRAKGSSYSCSGTIAKMWQAAYDGALSVAREPAQLEGMVASNPEEVIERLQHQIEYLTGVPSSLGTINDYRSPEVDAAILRCRERGDDETAHVLARLRLTYLERESDRPATLSAAMRAALRAEIINTPETADFMAGVPLEAAHQRDRWGVEHDAGKSPFDWFWLIGYLAQKAADAATRGHVEKAMHHTISTAAALANWHAALTGADTAMRPGIEPPVA